MSASYDPALTTDKDWIRFILGDTNVASARLSDEEIVATSSALANKYLAAAECLRALYHKWLSAGEGVSEKEVDDLRLEFGGVGSLEQRIATQILWLEKRGRFLQTPRSRVFRVVR